MAYSGAAKRLRRPVSATVCQRTDASSPCAPTALSLGMLLAVGACGNAAVPSVSTSLKALLSPILGSATLTAQQAAELTAGKWYLNLHTAANPDGEIRGQVELGS
jgi:hypothetical protein